MGYNFYLQYTFWYHALFDLEKLKTGIVKKFEESFPSGFFKKNLYFLN